MRTPADGWDADERDAIDALGPALRELQARHAGDPPLELLRAARADVLPDELRGDADRLLEQSAWHRALVDGANDAEASPSAEARTRLLHRVQQAHAQEERPVRRAIWRWQPLLAAAVLVMVAGMAAWAVWPHAEAGDVAATPEAQVAESEPAPATAVGQLPLEKPPIRVSATSLTFRGASSETGVLADLKPGLDAFRADDYQAAVAALAPLAERYPMSVEVPFYLGISHLFLGDADAALTQLARAATHNDSTFADDIVWYQAVASQRAGQGDAARAALTTLCRGTGPRAALACQAEARLP